MKRICDPCLLDRYSRIRLERLTKLARAAVLEDPSLLPNLKIYCDLLVQALIDLRYSSFAEQRVLGRLRSKSTVGVESARRLSQIVGSEASDWTEAELGSEQREPKNGLIGLPRESIDEWRLWLAGLDIDKPTTIVSVLSRGMADGAAVSRQLVLPTSFVCYSTHRLRSRDFRILDTIDLDPYGRRVLLVDAHAQSGETITRCWQEMERAGFVVVGAIITRCEAGVLVGAEFHVESRPQDGWAFLRPRASPAAIPAPRPLARAPMVILSGHPGSGKTLVRKAVAALKCWPAYSWSSAARRLVEALGPEPMDAFRLLTNEELCDPEIVCREFLANTPVAGSDPDLPVLVEGVKSLAGVRMLRRVLGRPPVVVRVTRDRDVREAAIRARADCDDDHDEERGVLLESIGLQHLMSQTQLTIDASGAYVDRTVGIDRIGSRTIADINRLFGDWPIGCIAVPTSRTSAKIFLFNPDASRVLLLRSAKSGKWGLPGGGVEPGETTLAAAGRELWEETGIEYSPPLQSTPLRLRSALELDGRLFQERITVVFVGVTPDIAVALSTEHNESLWAPLDIASVMLPRNLRDLLRPARALATSTANDGTWDFSSQ